MNVEVIAIGTELLLGSTIDTNGALIGRRLAEEGHDHFRRQLVGDNLSRIAEAIRIAVGRADAVVLTGGIGPTQDDVTREALCLVAGVEMEFDEEYAATLRERWELRGRIMPSTNLKQAQYPAGARLLPNPKGTAPGLLFEVESTPVFALPGVPAEMEWLLDNEVFPRLTEPGAQIVSRMVRTYGESESRLAELLADLYEGSENPTLAYLAGGGEIKLRLTARAEDAETAERLIDPLEAEIRHRLGGLVFAVGSEPVEAMILDALRERSWTVATAESATGGMVAARLTGVAGASDAVAGAVTTYSTVSKTSILGVDPELMAAEGVVSEATALAMAEGARSLFGADVTVAVTGSAGPDPQEQPVGTMCFAVLTPEGLGTRRLRLPGDRERVRAYAATTALHLIRLAVGGQWWER